jgi:hypothetical protein
MSIFKYLLFLIILITIGFSQSSVDDELIVVNTIDYRSYTGTVDSESTDSLYFSTYDGKSINISKSNILMTYNYNGRVKNGKLQRLDPNSSFYLFSPSAFSINNGNLYCRDFCLFYPSINYGIANIISLQVGAFWYPGMDYDNLPYIGNLKLTALESDIVSLALGASYIHLPLVEERDLISMGYAYGIVTFGNRYNHGSLSVGWGYVQEDEKLHQLERPIVVASANVRILNSVSFMTENWIILDKEVEDSLLSASIRFFGRQIAIDVGAIFSFRSIQDKIEPIPVINLTYHLR